MALSHDDSTRDIVLVIIIIITSDYGASPLLVSRASRSAVASFPQLQADCKVLERAHRPGSTGPVASTITAAAALTATSASHHLRKPSVATHNAELGIKVEWQTCWHDCSSGRAGNARQSS